MKTSAVKPPSYVEPAVIYTTAVGLHGMDDSANLVGMGYTHVEVVGMEHTHVEVGDSNAQYRVHPNPI